MVAQTVHRYIALLETIFLINLQPSWHTNGTLRYIKSPKVYLVDSGLLTYLLDVNLKRALTDPMQMGKILENFVVNEFKKQVTWSKVMPELYHFRTISGEKVDIVLENRAGKIVGIEIKNSNSIEQKDFKGLKSLRENAKKKFLKGLVFYTGSQYVPFGNNLYALPINSLWES